VVVVAVALVTALAVDLAYQTRVELQIAANGRDALRAQALARGSVDLARLVLHFQAQLDETSGQLQAAIPGMAAGQAGAAARPQIWRLVPITSPLVANLFGRALAEPAADPGARERAAAPAGPAVLAGLDGGFDAVIEDEDRKVNVQLDGLAQGGLLGAQLAALLELTADKKWDFLFDPRADDGWTGSRQDLAIRLKDWVDDDQAQSSLTGLPDRPFEDGFGDENYAYDRGQDRYRAKNARLDSLDELYLVAGVTDELMAAFGDRLTVYPSRNSQMNVNAADRDELLRNARIMADPPGQPLLSDPTLGDRLEKAVSELRMGGFLSMTPAQFAGLLEAMGISVQASYTQSRNVDRRGAFTDRSLVFHVRGTGTAGPVRRTVDAVVTFDPQQGASSQDLGRLLHWREE
jgi:general secretion pathway protein K